MRRCCPGRLHCHRQCQAFPQASQEHYDRQRAPTAGAAGILDRTQPPPAEAGCVPWQSVTLRPSSAPALPPPADRKSTRLHSSGTTLLRSNCWGCWYLRPNSAPSGGGWMRALAISNASAKLRAGPPATCRSEEHTSALQRHDALAIELLGLLVS